MFRKHDTIRGNLLSMTKIFSLRYAEDKFYIVTELAQLGALDDLLKGWENIIFVIVAEVEKKNCREWTNIELEMQVEDGGGDCTCARVFA